MQNHRLALVFMLVMAGAISQPACDHCERCDEDDCNTYLDDDTTDDDQIDDDMADDDTYDDDTGDDDTGDDDTGDPGLTWVDLPAGDFFMGCSEGDDLCNPDEWPRHLVSITSFSLTATEITQRQYEIVMNENPSFFAPDNGYEACPDCPVESVTWEEARTFCAWVSGRLPSEAEWEYAARAGTLTRYSCGNDITCLDDIAWYYDNAQEQTHPVGTKTANDWQLFDMLGNVWEWAFDYYDEDYYMFSPQHDPPGAEEGYFRVLRGGSWVYDSDAQWTVSDRFLQDPARQFNYVGFRCARN